MSKANRYYTGCGHRVKPGALTNSRECRDGWWARLMREGQPDPAYQPPQGKLTRVAEQRTVWICPLAARWTKR